MSSEEERKIKCVVWDLDDTLWDGVLMEHDPCLLKSGVVDTIKELDDRGILQSIASKNEESSATEKLKSYGLSDYFLYPMINFDSKSSSIKKITTLLNIGTDAIAFIDDQPFERDEVSFSLPEVLCIDSDYIHELLEMPEMNPRFITDDSSKRRHLYLTDIKRNRVEESFTGTKEEFLASLHMNFTILPATELDLQRAEELTVRTNQLNTTGYTYSYDELKGFCQSENHKLLVSSLEDKYGTYGTIGLSLIELNGNIWTIKLLLMSCRVMSRGVGNIMISYIRNEARDKGVRLMAEFVENDRNRMMYMTYKFAHFKEYKKEEELVILENDLTKSLPFPNYAKVEFT